MPKCQNLIKTCFLVNVGNFWLRKKLAGTNLAGNKLLQSRCVSNKKGWPEKPKGFSRDKWCQKTEPFSFFTNKNFCVFLEPETSTLKWLFQSDDSKSLPWKNGWKSPFPSIKQWLFGMGVFFRPTKSWVFFSPPKKTRGIQFFTQQERIESRL